MGFPLVAKAVRYVLKEMMKAGTATKSTAAIKVWKKIEQTGGPTKYGIGRAAMTTAMLHLIEIEVRRQFLMPLTDHDAEFRLPKGLRADLKEIMVKIPRWIAIEEGKDAIWISTLKARPEHWRMNAEMKQKKATQTQLKADVSAEVELFLEVNGFANLEDAIANS